MNSGGKADCADGTCRRPRAGRSWLCPLLSSALLAGCTSYGDDGELVRHHFGYVRVITPAVHAPETAVRVVDIETYGGWFYLDRRPAQEDPMGFGTGLGYQHDRREFIPLDCRLVVRPRSRAQLVQFMEILKASGMAEDNLCMVQDSSHQ